MFQCKRFPYSGADYRISEKGINLYKGGGSGGSLS